MGWFFFGILTAFGIEAFIRVTADYEPETREKTKRVQVSLPWYGWMLAGYSVLKTKKRSRK